MHAMQYNYVHYTKAARVESSYTKLNKLTHSKKRRFMSPNSSQVAYVCNI